MPSDDCDHGNRAPNVQSATRVELQSRRHGSDGNEARICWESRAPHRYGGVTILVAGPYLLTKMSEIDSPAVAFAGVLERSVARKRVLARHASAAV